MDTRKRVSIIAILLAGLFFNLNAFAQEQVVSKKEMRKLKRAIKKAEQAEYDRDMHQKASKAIEESTFVLKASTLYGRKGTSKMVSDDINFISVNGEEVVVQIAYSDLPGLNGLGGVTLKGRISGKELKTDRRGNTYVNFHVMGIPLSADIRICLSGGSNNADARINATTSRGKITFDGKILPLEDAYVYQSGLSH